MCKGDEATRNITDGSRWKEKSRQTKAEMVKEDIARNQMTTERVEDRKHWHVMIPAGTLLSVKVERLEGYCYIYPMTHHS